MWNKVTVFERQLEREEEERNDWSSSGDSRWRPPSVAIRTFLHI